MNKQAFYREFIPKIALRLFTFGIGAAILFLLFWYKLGGYNIWGHFLALCMKPLSFLMTTSFESGSLEKAAFFYHFKAGNTATEIGYQVNQLNSNLVILATIIATWPHPSIKQGLKFVAWCLLFTVIYQIFSFWVQAYIAVIGPGVADRFGLFWEPTGWYHFMRNVAGFDKFILRYYAAFPIVGLALTARYFADSWLARKK